MFALVLGENDLVRALGRAGIVSVVVRDADDPIRHSRFVREVVPRSALLEQPRYEGAPLFYDSDAALDYVSGERDRLAALYRFVLPEQALLDDLLDKGRFQALADRAGLPVPRARRVSATDADADLRFPVIVKASPHRDRRWSEVAGDSKVLLVDDPRALRDVVARLDGTGVDLIAQELVPGGEDRIESYHVYVDDSGAVVAEFTGRKIRTAPLEFGMTTSLETTDEADVAELGRTVIERIGFRGVAKLDFKRAPDGELHLLEINPRFTLWVHAGAAAGVNLPAIVYADLTGRPRPPVGRARPGVRWIWPSADAAAARESGVPLWRWLPWALRAETNSSFALTDPAPYIRGRLSGRRR
ncbi:MAG TPA: ATP-grasp domain-containing protein [Thermoleophilaceae bacterium]|nr:ATP-grasp domain-containing protein [Thermoleophilaceae bacterium]